MTSRPHISSHTRFEVYEMSQDQGASAKADRATRASPEPASGLGQKASVPCALPIVTKLLTVKSASPDFLGANDGGCHTCFHNNPDGPEAAARIEELFGALNAVDDYYSGRPPFDFHRLPDDQRANVAFDAWHTIADKMRVALRKARGQ